MSDAIEIANWYDNNPVVQAMKQVAYERGLAEGERRGRTAAAADIRDAQYPDPSPCIPAWHAGYTEAWERAARVAENGADHV